MSAGTIEDYPLATEADIPADHGDSIDAYPLASGSDLEASVTPTQVLGGLMNAMDRQDQEHPEMAAARTAHSELTKLAQGVPFLGHAFNVGRIQTVTKSANRISSGEGTAEDYANVVVHLRQQRELASRGIPHRIFDTVMAIPGFAQEYATTSGAFTLAKAATASAIPSLGAGIANKAVQAIVPRLVGAAAQAAANPALVAQSASEIAAPTIQSVQNPQGEYADVKIGDDKSFLSSLPAGFLDAAIEMGTERAGGHIVGALSKIPGAARLSALKDGIVGSWLSKPGRTTEMLNETLRQVGWNGVVGEVLEERAGDVARMTTGLQSPDQNVTGQLGSAAVQAATGKTEDAKQNAKKALEQLAVEGLSFSVPGAVNIAARGLDKAQEAAKSQPDTEFQDKMNAVEKTYREAELNRDTNASRTAKDSAAAGDLLPPGEKQRRRTAAEQAPAATESDTMPQSGTPPGPTNSSQIAQHSDQELGHRLAHLDEQLDTLDPEDPQYDSIDIQRQLVNAEIRKRLGKDVFSRGVSADASDTKSPPQDTAKPIETEQPTPTSNAPPEAVSDDKSAALRNMAAFYSGHVEESRPQTAEEHDAATFLKIRGYVPVFVQRADGGELRARGWNRGKHVFLRSGQEGGQLWEAVGHEIAHASGFDANNEIDQQLIEEAAKRYEANASPQTLERLASDPDMRRREGVAQLVGEFAKDQKIRDAIASRSPSLWTRLRDSILNALTGFSAKSRAARDVINLLKQEPGNASTVRSDQGQAAIAGSGPQGGGEARGPDLQQQAPGEPGGSAERPEAAAGGQEAAVAPAQPETGGTASPAPSDVVSHETPGAAPKEHVVTFETLRLGKKKSGRPYATPLIKEFSSAVPEFRYDPVLTVDANGKLVFRDGYKYTFEPEAFGLGPVHTAVDTSGAATYQPQVQPGDKVRVDLASLGLKPATEADVVADALKAQAFANVRVAGDGQKVIVAWKGLKIEITQTGPEQWLSPSHKQLTGALKEGVERANQTLERIRWSQGDPNAGPSKGQAGPSLGGPSAIDTFNPALSQNQPTPIGSRQVQPDKPKKRLGDKKPQTPPVAESNVSPPASTPRKRRLGDKRGEPVQGLGLSGEVSQQVGSQFAQKVPVNASGTSTAKRQVSARDIVATLAHDFGATLKYGRVPPPAAGIYKMYSEVARVRGNEMASLAVEVHELAHDVDKQTEVISQAVGGQERQRWLTLIGRAESHRAKLPYGKKILGQWAKRLNRSGAPQDVQDAVSNGDFDKARDLIRAAIGPQANAAIARAVELGMLDYDADRGNIQEGWAEFVRHYLTVGDTAQLAPHMTEWVEKEWLPAHPQYQKAFTHAKELIADYRGMTAEERASANKSQPGESPEPLDVPATELAGEAAGTMLDRLAFEWSDRFHYLEKMEQEAGEKGLVRSALDNTVSEVARWGDSTVMNHVKSAILGNGIRTIAKGKMRVLSKPLLDVFKPLRDGGFKADDWDNYHVARHVLEIEAINAAKNAERVQAGKQPIYYNPGMRYEDARAIVDRVEADPDKGRVFEQVSKDFSAFRDAILDMRADAGEITQELSDKLKAYYRKHASLKRVHPTRLIDRVFSRKGALNNTGNVKKRSAKGSGLPIMSQLNAVQIDLADAYQSAMTHVLKQKILSTVVKNEKYGFDGVEGMGHWAEVVDPKMRPNAFELSDILPQLVAKGVLEADDADLIKATNALRGGNPSSAAMKVLIDRFGTDDVHDLLKHTADVPSTDEVLVTFRPDYRPSEKEYIERLMVNGQPVLVEWNPYIYETFQSMGPMGLNAFERALAAVGDSLRTGATGLNLTFGAHQPLSDYLTYQFQAKEASVAGAAMRPFEMAGKISYGIAKELAGGRKSPTLRLLDENYGTLFEELAPGNEGSYQLEAKLFAKDALSQISAIARHPLEVGKALVSGVRKVGNTLAAFDLPSRLAEGVAVLKQHGYVEKRDAAGELQWFNEGTSQWEEPPIELQRKFAEAVANSTLSFRRAGRTGRYVNRTLFPYLNASLQGFLRMGRTIGQAAQGDKRAIAGLLSGTIAVGVISLINRAMMHGSDEEEEKEQFYKSSNWGFAGFRLRKPQSWQWVPNAIEATLDAIAGDPVSLARYAREELRQQSYFEIPGIDDDPVMGNVAKLSGIGPLAEAAANRDTFRDKKIEPQYMENWPAADRYDARTGPVAKAVGQVTGPLMDLGPKKIEHVIDRTTGGLLTRNPIRNPFRSYDTSQSKRDLEERLQTLRGKRDSAKHHGTAWSDAEEAEYDRLDRMSAMIPRVFKLMENKTAEKRAELNRWATGIARHAMGKAASETYPDPFRSYEKAPPELQREVDKYVVSLAGRVLAGRPIVLTPKEKKEGVTFPDKLAAWQRDRAGAKAILQGLGLTPEQTQTITAAWIRENLKDSAAESMKIMRFRQAMK